MRLLSLGAASIVFIFMFYGILRTSSKEKNYGQELTGNIMAPFINTPEKNENTGIRDEIVVGDEEFRVSAVVDSGKQVQQIDTGEEEFQKFLDSLKSPSKKQKPPGGKGETNDKGKDLKEEDKNDPIPKEEGNIGAPKEIPSVVRSPSYNITSESLLIDKSFLSLTCHVDQEVAIYVMSDLKDAALRQIIRDTWASTKVFWLTKAQVFFIIIFPTGDEEDSGKYFSPTDN